MIDVVGIGDDGWNGLPEPSRRLVADARVLVGGERHLRMVPTELDVPKTPWPRPLRENLSQFLTELGVDGGGLVVLASGDPLRSGVATTLIEVLGTERIRTHPAVSADSLARARLGWSAESCDVVTVVGRSVVLVRRYLTPGNRVIVLASGSDTLGDVARLLTEAGLGSSTLTVLGHLGGLDESRLDLTASHAAAETPSVSELISIAVSVTEYPDNPHSVTLGTAAGLPEEAFDHDGQLTKRVLRASALSQLRPRPGELLWDLGAGAGSVGIEWARHDPRCRTIAVEQDPERAERIRRNAAGLGVPGLTVRQDDVFDAVASLPTPDAVFIGGGLTQELLDAAWGALRPGGRIVVHAVTLETEAILARAHESHGGDLQRIAVEHAEPLGRYRSWTPARAVVEWAATKHIAEQARGRL